MILVTLFCVTEVPLRCSTNPPQDSWQPSHLANKIGKLCCVATKLIIMRKNYLVYVKAGHF
jgi:hypothetical protein